MLPEGSLGAEPGRQELVSISGQPHDAFHSYLYVTARKLRHREGRQLAQVTRLGMAVQDLSTGSSAPSPPGNAQPCSLE